LSQGFYASLGLLQRPKRPELQKSGHNRGLATGPIGKGRDETRPGPREKTNRLLRGELLNPFSGIDFARIEIPLGIHECHMDKVEYSTLMAMMAILATILPVSRSSSQTTLFTMAATKMYF
jgi:hypothetical protein